MIRLDNKTAARLIKLLRDGLTVTCHTRPTLPEWSSFVSEELVAAQRLHDAFREETELLLPKLYGVEIKLNPVSHKPRRKPITK